jgi:hypothetical protein
MFQTLWMWRQEYQHHEQLPLAFNGTWPSWNSDLDNRKSLVLRVLMFAFLLPASVHHLWLPRILFLWQFFLISFCPQAPGKQSIILCWSTAGDLGVMSYFLLI